MPTTTPLPATWYLPVAERSIRMTTFSGQVTSTTASLYRVPKMCAISRRGASSNRFCCTIS